ncbi:DUF2919 domain-containing protein [Pseudoalteromonas sp. C2R02]|uniref:DUF2919 domain-containing protein n=1 Tax=Pseudoalteromonas sp. C2R02 TaxID=2841565 RepID=UPI001C0A6593|nr:DUF2919 domain-containing protein [Pseudoalteromonas sp. C2R02]MBU2970327.1 DUF2919 domain-containing protein [Pseudoalteromonas sp. C2R02]
MRFGPEFWDKHGVYRAPIALSFTFLILLRTYIIWIFSAVSRRPDLDLMSLFYRNKNDFFIALAIGALALLPAVIFSLRRPSSNPKLAKAWRFMKTPLVLCCVLDLAWLLMQAKSHHFQFSAFLAIQLLLVSWVLFYLIRSKYLPVFFNDWPTK